LSHGRTDGVAVIAEGVALGIDPNDLAQLEDIERDAHGNVRIAEMNIGEILKHEVLAQLKEYGLNSSRNTA
jgi:6-phosphofructokinase 1